MSGRDLQKIQNELGVSPEAVCNEAGVSMTTLYKVYAGEHVRTSSVSKVRNALARLREKMGSTTLKQAVS